MAQPSPKDNLGKYGNNEKDSYMRFDDYEMIHNDILSFT